jgi:hypothetical protein
MSRTAMLQKCSNVSSTHYKMALPVLSPNQPIQHTYNKLNLKMTTMKEIQPDSANRRRTTGHRELAVTEHSL